MRSIAGRSHLYILGVSVHQNKPQRQQLGWPKPEFCESFSEICYGFARKKFRELYPSQAEISRLSITKADIQQSLPSWSSGLSKISKNCIFFVFF